MSKAKAPRVFVPLVKVDEEQRLVYGRITAEEVDQSGEVMDYETSKPHFEKWSNDIEAASGGLSKGNLRVMHGLTVAGKLTDLAFDDDSKSIEVCSKVVDDAEWTKVLEGCYTGFSVGGRYGKKWNDTVDGNTIKKFTAIPNEVSLVDNPCVKSATFTCVKADGAEELIKFANPGDLVKADVVGEEVIEEPAVMMNGAMPSNAEVVAKAEQMAAEAADDTTWIDYVEAARDELVKAAASEDKGDAADSKKKKKAKGSDDEEAEAASGSSDDESVEGESKKSVLDELSQKWVTTDGQSFDKKADAAAHQETLAKAEVVKTEAELLAERLSKATTPAQEPVAIDLMDDPQRLAKVFDALSTPFDEEGQPVLEKGMYTVGSFAKVLLDLHRLRKSIAAEGAEEGNDSSDVAVSEEIKKAVNDLGASFKTYAADQVEELIAGLDTDELCSYYDYYYAAAHSEGGDALAKDVCSALETFKDSSRERRETLAKAFVEIVEEVSDELSPPMQKRFDELTKAASDMKKVAEDAVAQVEELAKRVQQMEDTPLPPAPRNVAWREGDGQFFGKVANTEEEKRAVLAEMVANYSPEELATMMIKASHATGGHQLALNR